MGRPMKTFRTSLAVALLSSGFALGIATSSPAMAAECKDLPPPKMVIKIFNRDPKLYIFPVLTMGKGPVDTWLQSCFKIPANDIGANPFPRGKNFRLYAFPATGIAPQKRESDPVASIVLTLPLYTQMVSPVVPTALDQYIDWWQGGTIQLYTSETASPPKALLDAIAGKNEGQDQKVETPSFAGAVLPDCPACQQPLRIYSDIVDLPKNDPSQLIEFTLGAQQVLLVKNPATDPPKKLDLRNVDFDVSYVNVAYMPAAMGPYQNDQVGYVGTPQSIDTFKKALNNFLTGPRFKGWPRFVKTYADKSKETILKLPSPLELFARLATNDPNPPPDLELPPSWPKVLWKPIDEMRENWKTYAGTMNADGKCKATTKKDTFCDALIDAKKFMKANYDSYRANFGSKCMDRPLR